jgi:hypothetical protein
MASASGGPAAIDTKALCQPSGNLTLFARPWHLLNVDRKGLAAEFQVLRKQGVVADMEPVMWHERPLAACDDMLTVCLPLK